MIVMTSCFEFQVLLISIFIIANSGSISGGSDDLDILLHRSEGSALDVDLADRKDSQSTRQKDSCDNILEKIQHRNFQVPTAKQLNLKGIWISERCEVRPGPEFILRRYHFTNNTHFQLLQFYYMDPYCSRPFYGLEANGIMHVAGRKESWTVLGAIEAPLPMLLQVQVMPYTREAALYLQNKAAESNSKCSKTILEQNAWRPESGPFIILSYVEYSRRVLRDLDCTAGIGFNLHEFMILRLEQTSTTSGGRPIERSLLLGSLPTRFSLRSSFSPTSYQAPLVDLKNPLCRLCRPLRRALLKQPPELSDHLLDTSYPFGEWVSLQCESQHGAVFVTRRLLFESDKRTWHGYYYYYQDARCRRPYITIYATGQITQLDANKDNLDSRNYDFVIKQVQVIPRDLLALRYFNAYNGLSCGRNGEWVVNVGQDVTATGGCELLQIQVPETIAQVLRLEKSSLRELLFMGEMPNSGEPKTLRPTSFQAPLIRCRNRVSSEVSQRNLTSSLQYETFIDERQQQLQQLDRQQEPQHTLVASSVDSNHFTILAALLFSLVNALLCCELRCIFSGYL